MRCHLQASRFLLLSAGATFTAAGFQAPPANATARQLFFTEKLDKDPKKKEPPAKPAIAPVVKPVAQPARYFGMRYSVLRVGPGGAETEVDPETSFRANDQVRLELTSNQGGHLYVVHQGSRGDWDVLLPEPGQPAVILEAMRPAKIPEQVCFTFDKTPGVERLFIVVSAAPEQDMEALIQGVQARKGNPDKEVAQLAVEGMRDRLGTRNLRIEKVRPDDQKRENAVYVVDASENSSRVVFDIVLQHRE